MWSRQRVGVALSCVAAIVLASSVTGLAQSDHSTVVRVLRESRDFRARVRAALALGSSNDRAVVPYLVGALGDASPAVRASAATGLGNLGDRSALDALQIALNDNAAAVRSSAQNAIRRIEAASPAPASPPLPTASTALYPPIAVVPAARDIHWPNVRYVVVLGSMENRSAFREGDLSQLLHREVERNLIVLRGIAVLNAGQVPPSAHREIQRRRLPHLRLEGSLNRVDRRREQRQLSVRCEVSIMVLDEPGRNIRGVLNGAATGSQTQRAHSVEQERRLAEQALSSAVRSAMSGAARAIASVGR